MTSGIFCVLTTFVIFCCNFSPGFVLVSDPLWSRPLLGWEFSGCPVTKTWGFYCWGPGSIPCWATKIPQAEWCNQKKKKKTATWLAYRYFTLSVSWAEPMFSTEPAPPPGSLNSGNVWSSTQFLVKSWLIRSPTAHPSLGLSESLQMDVLNLLSFISALTTAVHLTLQ